MSQGIAAATDLPRGRSGRTSSNEEPFERICHAFGRLERAPALGRALGAWQEPDRLLLYIHPAEEFAVFSVAPDGRLIVRARTSGAGPGYHAHLIDRLEALGAELALNWEWQGEEAGDTTGYALDRDFRSLQETMARQLKALCATPGVHDALPGCKISMPADFTPHGDFFAASPIGTWDRDWLVATAAAEGAELMARAASFYPWWEKGYTGDTAYNLGLTMMQMRIAWRPPDGPGEEKAIDCALAFFEDAQRLGCRKPLPAAELAELRALREADPDDPPVPRAEGIGYYRGLLTAPLPDGWSLRLPGYFYGESDDRGDPYFVYGDREVHFSAMTVEASTDDLWAAFRRELGERGGEIIEFDHPEIRVIAGLAYNDRAGCYMLHGRAAANGRVAMCTVCYKDEADRDWALGVLESLDREPPAQWMMPQGTA